jgi:dTDP-4-dehydrorhamnose 3,5-epimerase
MGNFDFQRTSIEGLYVIEPKVYEDARGFFMETYTKKAFEDMGIHIDFVQDNHSKSEKNVLRGLHFQVNQPQGKLLRVISGSIYDVAVDLRRESPTYGQWYATTLSADNKRQFYVPPRFAHGFLTLEDQTEVLYKTTDYYHPEDEGGIIYNDSTLNISWPVEHSQIILSDKDKKLPKFDR